MAITWKEIWDRYNYFTTSANKEEKPASITSAVDRSNPAEYDVNFQQALKSMAGSEDMNSLGVFGASSYISWISSAEQTKEIRVKIYREMERNSWVDAGLDEYISAGYNEDEKGESISFKLKNEDLANNENIRDNLTREFNHIIDKVIDYDIVFTEWFREFVLMGEAAVELLIPHDNIEIRRVGVKGVKLLRSEQYVAYHNSNGDLNGFVVRNPFDDSVRTLANKEQIAYVDSGIYDYVSGIGFTWAKHYVPTEDKTIRIPRSFIEAARKPHKQLDSLEDSVVIYRLSRAPERLVFNVATGNLPKNRAEQYLNKLINKFRKKLTYNPDTGEIDQSQNVKNIMEDFWFLKDNTGKGTDVSSIGGGVNLGEIEDIQYFLQKLYRGMKVPFSRITGEAVFDQAPGGMSSEEIKFQKYVYYILKKFVGLIRQIYIQHLKIKGIWDHYNLKKEDIGVYVVPPSYFSYLKNSEFLEAQFARFANFANNIDVETPIFSTKMALKEGLGWSDEKIAQNNEWLKEQQQEKASEDLEGEENLEDEGGDLGGDGGGGDLEI